MRTDNIEQDFKNTLLKATQNIVGQNNSKESYEVLTKILSKQLEPLIKNP